MMKTVEMKGITCCGDCVYYNFENDRCKRGASIEETGSGYFYKDCPLTEVVPVSHGHWIMEQDGGTRCSVCKKKVHDVTDGNYAPVDLSELPYCPKCGAKMDAGDGEE